MDTRTLFDNITENWILVDTEGEVLLVSRHLENFQHLFPEPIKPGTSLLNLLSPSWRALAQNMIQTMRTAPTPSVVETSHVMPDGRELWFEVKSSPIPDEKGQHNWIFIQARDLTPQKIFEKKITLIARDLQDVIENANAVIIGVDVRGYITEWNSKAQQVIGFSKDESYIKRMADLLQVKNHDTFIEAEYKVFQGEVITNHELSIRAKGGKPLTLLINATPRRSAGGEVIGALFIGQDVTELTAYREQLERLVHERTDALKNALENERRLVEVKDRFVSMASHEFRSPIMYIRRHIGRLKDELNALTTEDLADRVARIQTQAEHLTDILEDVLTIARSGSTPAKIEARPERLDLLEFLQRIVDEVQDDGHRIVLECPYTSLWVRSDEKLLRNVFVNLLTNALKFSPEDSKVVLSLFQTGKEVVCRVIDRGVGISSSELSRIFEPFHRGSNVRDIRGTGLGLSIVKRAIDTLGGEIQVQSTLGQGTTFTVKLRNDGNG